MAEAAAAAFSAFALLLPVLAETAAAAFSALALLLPVLAEAAAAAFSARVLLFPVLADAAAAAFSAPTLLLPVLAEAAPRPRLLRRRLGSGGLVVHVRQSAHSLLVGDALHPLVPQRAAGAGNYR